MTVTQATADQIAERGGTRLGKVVVFSANDAKYVDVAKGSAHRDHTGTERQDFSIQDREGGVTYHASFARESKPGYQPRHRHGMEQIRLMLSGEMKYIKKTYGAGWLGFFPEGVFYGPHEWTKPGAWIVSQEQGPSNGPFHSREELADAIAKLKEVGGSFTDGFYIWPDGKKQDGHEACMEVIYGGKIKFPPAQFADPVWVDTNKFEWSPSKFDGVAVKRLGLFGEVGPAIEMIEMSPGSTIPGGTADRIIIRWIYEGEAKYGSLSCPGNFEKEVSNISYSPGAEYEPLISENGAKILSVEIKIPDGALPYLV